MAAAGVAEHAVFHAVERVAFVVHGVREQGNFRGGDVAVAFHGHGGPEVAAGVVAGPVVGGVARDDAVEIGRIALGFDERFMRIWEFYLAYCEAAFDTGDISLVQYTLQKSAVPSP